MKTIVTKLQSPVGVEDFFMQLDVKEHLELVNQTPRYTGRATIRIMALIATAMQNPGKEYQISDVPKDRALVRDVMVPKLEEIIIRIGLQGFDIYIKDDGNWYVMFSGMPENDE